MLAKCVEELQKHGGIVFEAYYVCMNPGYNEANKIKILENAKILNINLEMFDSDIFEVANSLNEKALAICVLVWEEVIYIIKQKN